MAVNVTMEELASSISAIKASSNQWFLVTMGMIVFFMQCGFAFLEAGAVRSKNTTNILIKNMLDSFVSGIAYWAVGYPLAFGEGNLFLGYRYWFSESLDSANYAHWFFHFVFAATAATIVSGAMAERCEFAAYFVYSFLITGVVYPIVTHWAWSSEGWLAKGDGTYAYQDFAGSGVVHLLGGTAAMCGAILLGPRIGRFDKETGKARVIRGHSVPLAALGGFILLFGFFAFNGGSQAQISDAGDGEAVARAIMNTCISGSFAGFTAMIMKKVETLFSKQCCLSCDPRTSDWSLLTTLNGALTGMVAICAGCNVVDPWAAAVIGVIAAVAYHFWSCMMLKMKIDDPLDAVAVHFGGGLWGIMAAPIFKIGTGIVFKWDYPSGMALAWNMIGGAAIIGWTAVICIVMFGVLRCTRLLRVSEEIEIKGLDVPKHGEPAYPSEAFGDGWGNYLDSNMSPVTSNGKHGVSNGGFDENTNL